MTHYCFILILKTDIIFLKCLGVFYILICDLMSNMHNFSDSPDFLRLDLFRALDKREYFDDNFSYFSSKPYVVTPYLNHLLDGSDEWSTHYFLYRLNNNYPYLSPNTPAYPYLELYKLFILLFSLKRVLMICMRSLNIVFHRAKSFSLKFIPSNLVISCILLSVC